MEPRETQQGSFPRTAAGGGSSSKDVTPSALQLELLATTRVLVRHRHTKVHVRVAPLLVVRRGAKNEI
jgi:hypothetical protein